MIGIKYDFDVGDVVIGNSGQFETATIDNQCVALISLSQVCRLTLSVLWCAGRSKARKRTLQQGSTCTI